MTRHESILCGVFGSEEGFVFVRADQPGTAESLQRAKDNGLAFCGAVGIINGVPGVRFEPGTLPLEVMLCATDVFLKETAHLLTSPEAATASREPASEQRSTEIAESAEWLTRLWALEDSRPTLSSS